MKNYGRLVKRNYRIFVGIIIFMVFILWSICGIRANAAERAENDKTMYQLQETLFVKEVRERMGQAGYCNSGITLTKVMDTDGTREYKVLVHHSDIDLEDLQEVNSVYAMLNEVILEGENVSVNFQIF